MLARPNGILASETRKLFQPKPRKSLMKKKSTLQSGFLKLRVSLSLLLFSAGVFLALLGSGLFAIAEEQQAPLRNSGIQFGQSYHNDVSPALRDLAMLWPAPEAKVLEAREANLNPKI